jgi:hypothetical protein
MALENDSVGDTHATTRMGAPILCWIIMVTVAVVPVT